MRHSGPVWVPSKHHTYGQVLPSNMKIIFVAQPVYKVIHQGPGTGWLPSNIKNIIIGTSERNWKYYKCVQHGQSSCLNSGSYDNQAILSGAVNMHTNFIMGTRCVYNWTNMMVDMGIYTIVNHDTKPRHASIFNAWIEG